MDIRKKLRELLTEGKHKKTHKNEYGCVMVNLDINKWIEENNREMREQII
jgi:hypothetical protein